MSEIPREMSFETNWEWAEAMCDLMCGGDDYDDIDDDDELVCDTDEEDY